jgi:hypothetical protein
VLLGREGVERGARAIEEWQSLGRHMQSEASLEGGGRAQRLGRESVSARTLIGKCVDEND